MARVSRGVWPARKQARRTRESLLTVRFLGMVRILRSSLAALSPSPTVKLPRLEETAGGALTFNPMQRMVPTSAADSGDSMRLIVSIALVGDPGFKTEDPLNTRTCTASPLRTALPTSISRSTGSPMRAAASCRRGRNRTSPNESVRIF